MKKLILLSFILLTGCIDIGHGEKVGVVTRVVHESGMFCKTDEIEIIRGGMNTGTGVVGSAFRVTVTNPAMFAMLTKAMETQQEVKITYVSEFASFCRSDSDSHFLTSVEIANPIGIDRPVKVEGQIAILPKNASPVRETRDQKIKRLLAIQAELLQELAKEETK